jgi:hypothetical protein
MVLTLGPILLLLGGIVNRTDKLRLKFHPAILDPQQKF